MLLIITDAPGESLRRAKQRLAGDSVSVLNFDLGTRDESLPEAWRRLPVADLLDTELLRRDFLEFVDAWPRRPLSGGKSFEEIFRRPEGYSVWWTGPGIERHPDVGVFAKLQTLWICDRAIRAVVPRRVLIHTGQAELAWSLASRCRRGGCEHEFLPDSARPTRNPYCGSLRWLAGSLAGLVWFPWPVLLRAVLVRWLARTPPETAQQHKTPAVVFASPLLNYRIKEGRVSMDRWRQLWEAVAGRNPGLRCRYLGRNFGRTYGYPATRLPKWRRWRQGWKVLRQSYLDWQLLRRVEGAAPIRERYLACGAWLRSLPVQLASLLRYLRLEGTPAFRESLIFAGADVCCFYVPLLRRAIGQLSEWSQTAGSIVESLRAVGNVKAVLVTEEMYPVGTLHIAAAHRLGIPAIGLQHGTIFPMHLIYTPPPGQLQHAPTPDYVAVYGEYAKETFSVHGSFPADRVWITGEPRFDHLVKEPPDAADCRERLGLPQGQRIVLVATQYYPWFPEVAKAVFEATKDAEDCLVCLKTHWKDVSLDLYRQIARRTGTENVRFFDDEFEELLAACDVLISGSSTAVFEAILLGRRTICVNFSAEPDRYPYVADGGSVPARSPGQVRVALEKVFSAVARDQSEAARERFLRRHAGPSAEGRAADALAARIVALCSERKVPREMPILR